MRKIALDIFLIILSGVISFFVSVSHPEFGNMEMDALLLVIISGAVSILTLLTYVVITFWPKFYRPKRWWIVGILSAINVITGIVVYFNEW